jgi:hypothetical protein
VGRTTAQEPEIACRDLPAVDVVVAGAPEQGLLHGAQAGVRHPVAEQAPHDRQQVQVAVMQRCRSPDHPKARHEQRPVESATVVGDQPRVGRDMAGEFVEDRRLVRVVGQQELHLAEGRTVPPPESDAERDRPGRGREAGRLRVEADEGPVGIGLTGQPGQSRSVHRDGDRRSLDADEPTDRRPDDLAIERGREPIGECRRAERSVGQGTVRATRVRLGRPEPRQASGEVRCARGRVEGHAGTRGEPAPSSARSRSARPFASTPGSRRGPVQAGQPPSHPHAATSAAAPATSSS